MNTPQQKKQINWDKISASYYWIIFLNPNHRHNHVECLYGYSKVYDQREREDKTELLKHKILMLYQNDFLNPERVLKIEIYQRADDVINKKVDPKILTLYPDKYVIDKLNETFILNKYGAFLVDFYNRVSKRLSMEGLVITKRKPKSKDEYLNPAKEFKSLQQLYSYATNLLRYGHAPGEVEHFLNKVKQRYNWNI